MAHQQQAYHITSLRRLPFFYYSTWQLAKSSTLVGYLFNMNLPKVFIQLCILMAENLISDVIGQPSDTEQYFQTGILFHYGRKSERLWN